MIPASRMQAVSYGESKPIESNSTADGRSVNRRIEIEIGAGRGVERAGQPPFVGSSDVNGASHIRISSSIGSPPTFQPVGLLASGPSTAV